jgi:hypothetical protein
MLSERIKARAEKGKYCLNIGTENFESIQVVAYIIMYFKELGWEIRLLSGLSNYVEIKW